MDFKEFREHNRSRAQETETIDLGEAFKSFANGGDDMQIVLEYSHITKKLRYCGYGTKKSDAEKALKSLRSFDDDGKLSYVAMSPRQIIHILERDLHSLPTLK